MLRPGGVENGEGVAREHVDGVVLRAAGATGLPGGTTVERDHPVRPGEVGHLELPMLGRHDRPRRHEQHGGVAVAEAVPMYAYAVTVDVARLVGTPGLHPARSSRSRISWP